MDIDEAEIQVLATLFKAESEGSSTDRAAIETLGDCYAEYREDWTHAFDKLKARGWIDGDDSGYRLTDSGRPMGDKYRGERPDLYWYHYQNFYPAAHASSAHSKLCERVFGEDLCQEGQTDMTSLEQLMEHLDLRSGEDVIDLGCGAGVIAEYISDQTGCRVTGVDYAASAIAEANQRTVAKRSRLEFMHGDFSSLVLEPESYDAVVAIDTLYWVDVLERTLSTLAGALRPGGRMGIFLNHHIEPGDSPERLKAEYSPLWQVLTGLGLTVDTVDFTNELREFWERLHSATLDLQEEFEAEGNGFIAQNYLRECEQDHLPEIYAGTIARYLYLVKC